MRVLIVVTHLLGVGHLSRAAALGRAFAAAGHRVTLASGGRPAPNVATGDMELVQLPPVHVRGADFRTLYDDAGGLADPALMQARKALLLETFARVAPDAVIVELYPFGRRQLADEFDALLDRCRQAGTATFCSIRDVLNPTADAAKIGRTMRLLGRFFDGVLVHSDPAVLPLEASFPVEPALSRRLRYTGYVGEDAGAPAGAPPPDGEILVSGGGSAASLPLMRAALGAARLSPRRWRLLVGHGVSEPDFAALAADAPANAHVERVRRDFVELLGHAACSVSQFGYNTALDLAAAGVPAVVVPFDAGNEQEQGIRAGRFAAMGLVEVVANADLSAQTLLAAAGRTIARPRGPRPALAMRGAERTVDIVARGVADGQAEAAAWLALGDALERASSAGRTIAFWWRDDDAIRPTPALDRLLELGARFGAPLALAVIPQRAEAALAERISGETLVEALVHGVAHRDNAPPGAKKQELVAADAATLAGLAAGRERLEALLGRRALPVLVPPWNRIAPEVVAALPSLGFKGWSGFSGALRREAGAVHTQVDPIDWKAGGGLAAAAPLIARLTGLVDAAGAQENPAPIGLLTHHLVHDEWVWRFLERLLGELSRRKCVRYVRARTAFGLT